MERLWTGQTIGKSGKIYYASSIHDAVKDAELVQESAPERLELKQKIHTEIGASAHPDAVIGSSTSGLLPSEIQKNSPRPERLIVAHPYNPVYLLPVVEIVGGKKTSTQPINKAMTLSQDIGMKPVHIQKEIDAFVGDRLLEAMWRESLWLINDDVATTQVIDDVVRYGLGLRYAQMGQFMTYRLGGGEGGMKHFLEQFGPTLELPWTKLMDVPEWNDALIDKVAQQSDAQADGKSIRDLEEIRDNNLVDMLKALNKNNWGAGVLLKNPAEDSLDKKSEMLPEGNILQTWTGRVDNDWTDYNGHMTEFRYLQVFSMATDTVMTWIGGGPAYVKTGASWYTVETHIKHIDEVSAGREMKVETLMVDHDDKRIHLFHHLYDASDARLLATAEHMLIHVDMNKKKSSEMPRKMKALCDTIASRQKDNPKPPDIGAAIAIRRK